MKLSEYQIPDTHFTCPKCKSLLHEGAFPYRFTPDGTRVRQKVCRSCVRDRRRCAGARLKAASLVDEARNKPCADCKQVLPLACMGLSPPDDAEFSPTKEAGRVSEKRLRAVLERCVPVCANCRAIRQYENRRKRSVPSLRVKGTPALLQVLSELKGNNVPPLADVETPSQELGRVLLDVSRRLTDLTAGQGSDSQDLAVQRIDLSDTEMPR